MTFNTMSTSHWEGSRFRWRSIQGGEHAALCVCGRVAEAAWTRPSADLYVAGSVKNSKDTGKSSGVTYAVGAVKGVLISLIMM